MWQDKNDSLYRLFEFKDFDQAFEFMTQVAAAAAQQNHHPRWQNEYNKVEIWLSSHDTGDKITAKDHQLAEAIDGIYDKPKTKETDRIEELKVFTDGGSRGNPGPSAYAFVICKKDNTVVKKYGGYIGVTTNNQAEYEGLRRGLAAAKDFSPQSLEVYMDSELVIKQMNGQYKVKNPDILAVYKIAKALADEFPDITFNHVPREMNKIADAEVNRILDKAERKIS
jgi:ribonuclease HI